MADSLVKGTPVQFPPSWIDRLTGWISRLPGPTWLFYILIISLGILLNHAVFWIDGGLPLGAMDTSVTLFSFYTLYWIGLYHYLTRSSSHALQRFRPLLRLSDARIKKIDFQLGMLPRGLGWLALILGIITSIATAPWDLEYQLGSIANQVETALPAVYYTAGTFLLASTFFVLFFRTIRQFSLIGKLHKRATRIDLLDLDPPHAFSGLTARAGTGMILLLVIISIQGPWDAVTALDVLFYTAIALLAVVVFVVPLQGMRQRLQEEKDHQMRVLGDLLHAASSRFHDNVRNEHYKDMVQTKDAINTLLLERDRLQKTSTWPWQTSTIRGFASTLLLPIFLLLVTRLIENLF